jgi:glycosyltransferase involved in cell wall biosynthesis
VRILIVIHSLHSGGAERVAANLSRAWIEQGWELSIVTLTDGRLDFFQLHPAVKRIALDLAGDSIGLLSAVRANLRRIRALRKVIREECPDIVLGMMSTSGVLSVLACWGLGCRVFVSERTYPPRIPLGAFWEYLRRWTYPKATAVVAQTEEGKAWIEHHCPGAKVTAIPNHVTWPLESTEPHLSPESVVSPKRRLLLAVGRLGEEKQFHVLIEAFASLAQENKDCDLVILGEGGERQALETQLRELGLGERVKLPGRAGNVGDWYRRADIFVLSSRFEGFPNVLLEAMACGCPAVSFDCQTGPREIIRNGVDGILVAPKSGADGLAMAIRRLLADEPLRLNMAANATAIRQRYSMEVIRESWNNLLAATSWAQHPETYKPEARCEHR